MKNRYKLLLILSVTGWVLSCSEGTREVENKITTVMENEVQEVTEPIAVEEVEMAPVPNEKWQINHYAEYLLKAEIVEDAESANFQNGPGWHYAELDLKGGYAYIMGAAETWYEYVIWRMADGKDLVGEMSVGCGPACSYEFNFYVGKGVDIREVSLDEIMPLAEIEDHRKKKVPKINEKYPVDYPEDSQLVFNLPQKGTAMQVDIILGADEIRIALLKLGWDKSTFFVEELYEEIEVISG